MTHEMSMLHGNPLRLKAIICLGLMVILLIFLKRGIGPGLNINTHNCLMTGRNTNDYEIYVQLKQEMLKPIITEIACQMI